MSKRKKRKNTIKKEIYTVLSGFFKAGKGRSRKEDKKKGLDKDKIYSEKTYHNYLEISKGYADWIREKHPECRHLKQTKAYINDWIQDMIDRKLAPGTIAVRKTALMKLFQVDSGEYLSPPPRYRSLNKRSRYEVEYDKHISKEKEAYWARINEALGLRRSELKRITGKDLQQDENTGKYYLEVTRGTKSGKPREAEILDETGEIIKLLQMAGDRPAFANIPKPFDCHHYRGNYAKKLYNKYARPLNEIPKKDRYYMRREYKGVILDKKAMQIVSNALGHDRLSVIAQSYLY